MRKKPNPTSGDMTPLMVAVIAITELVDELIEHGMTRPEALQWTAVYFGTLYREEPNAPS